MSNGSDVLLVTSNRFRDHVTPPGHPERVARAEVMATVGARWAKRGGATADPRPATSEELRRVHASRYVDEISGTAGQHVRLDPDTHTSPDSHAVARLAAGAAIVATDHALGAGGRALALVRPPGHHAEADRAMGFCLFNNVAVAATYALTKQCDRLAIVDYDVHHGNGTQWTFYEDPRVLYVSVHQYPFYPGTGAADQIGRGKGAGFTVNVPLEAGATDADYDRVFREIIAPVLTMFAPKVVMVSAGYDAHDRDPLGGMKVSTEGYAAQTRWLRRVADQTCQGRMVLVTEGGYDLQALEECLESTLQIISGPPPAAPTPLAGPTPRADAALRAVKRAQAPYWPKL